MINAADLAQFGNRKWNKNVKIASCTFGAPAAGNRAWAKCFSKLVADSTRVVVHDDIVTYLPCFPWFSVSSGVVYKIRLFRTGELGPKIALTEQNVFENCFP